MKIAKEFESLLKLMGINLKKYAKTELNDNNGNKYTLSEIDEEKILNFEWARYLAQNNELVMLNNGQETEESLKVFEDFVKNKTGHNINLGKAYKEDLKKQDYGRYELSKDIYYLIREASGEIQKNVKMFSRSYPMYIESGMANEFFICFVDPKDFKEYKILAENLGILTFYIFGSVNSHGLYKNYYQTCTINGKNIVKEFYNENRNANIIMQTKHKQQEMRAKQLNFEMNKKDDEKFTQLAQKLYNEISEFGLAHLEKDNPQLRIKEFLVDVFKVLLYKKWVTYKNIVDLEVNSGYFFHLYEDQDTIPSKQDLIFDIIDRVKDR